MPPAARLVDVVADHAAVGVSDVILIVRGEDPVGLGERVAEQLPRLRELG